MPAGTVSYVAKTANETTTNGAGIEIVTTNGSNADRTKQFIWNQGSKAFDLKSANDELNMQLTNTASYASYYSIHNGSAQKKLLTENALFLDTSNSITGNSDSAAIYLSKNGGSADSDNDWRMRISSDKFVIEQYNAGGTAWEVRFEVGE